MGEWVKRWGYEVSPSPVRPGIYRVRQGGHLLRATTRVHRGGKDVKEEAMRYLPASTLPDATRARDELVASLKRPLRSRPRWHEYAASLFDRKVTARDLKSAATVERWSNALEHHLVPAFGDHYCDELRLAHVLAWRDGVAARIARTREAKERGKPLPARERVSAVTANGWISILRAVCAAMTVELELPRNPAVGLSVFDTSEEGYTEEQPNSLLAEQAARFLAALRADDPNMYPMALLGFVTGLRPSSMRPLRRKGPEPDLDLEARTLSIRRSNSRRQAVMRTTKTGLKQRLHLPEELVEALREHVAFLESGEEPGADETRWGKRRRLGRRWTEAQKDSPLLFPSLQGGMRSRSCLDKPFARACKAAGITVKLTPRGMRRTFKDLARAAGVSDLVSKAVSGHITETMHEHYQTVGREEMRGELAKVVQLVDRPRSAPPPRPVGAPRKTSTGAPSEGPSGVGTGVGTEGGA